MNPLDPFREAPVAFDEWVSSYDDPSKESRLELATAAKALLRNAPAMRVIAEIEKNAIVHLSACPLGNPVEAQNRLSVLNGARSFRKALQMLAQDQDFDEKGCNSSKRG